MAQGAGGVRGQLPFLEHGRGQQLEHERVDRHPAVADVDDHLRAVRDESCEEVDKPRVRRSAPPSNLAGVRVWIVVVVVVLLVTPAAAHAQTGGTAPSYPGNTLTVEAAGPLVGGRVERVKLSGHAQWNEPTDEATISYSLALYVQNADVDPNCAPSYGAQLQKSINLSGLNASTAISGFVVSENQSVSPTPPAPGVRFGPGTRSRSRSSPGWTT